MIEYGEISALETETRSDLIANLLRERLILFMPTYGYRCTSCGHEFEVVQKMTDAPLTECESCGAPVKKMLYPVGIAFKGTGFYVNDSRGPAGGESKPKDAGDNKTSGDSAPTEKTPTESVAKTDAAPAEKKTETKTETKSEAKTEKTP